ISAPWSDVEQLFRPGVDFLFAHNGSQMRQHLRAVLADADFAASLVTSGLETIRSRHTCQHRVDELFGVLMECTTEHTINKTTAKEAAA
ncbi:glycosyltransferase family 1 protein, partial [Mesorhizobium sp. M7A.T.Ca.TU.009.01.3.2]